MREWETPQQMNDFKGFRIMGSHPPNNTQRGDCRSMEDEVDLCLRAGTKYAAAVK